MIETQLLVNADIGFDTCEEVLDHISELLTKEGYVKESYHAAIHERESVFPTGIDLGFGAVAIPHCDATHANKPCVYLIKPNKPVPFARADDDGELEAELIIALVVTDPAEQMQLLRALFTSLQNEEFFNELKAAITIDGLAETFSNTILKSNEE
ncbi:PTS galactitol transporter subunit IIA [Vibrio owensii]|uniref:PTS galactitol transporter subunit IIA n=1 Tax=Vibrio owensii TaxID=696485 RepID=UPI0018F1D477|nr:PTS galactitol transporter subunit IIA [Vibrio owensii]